MHGIESSIKNLPHITLYKLLQYVSYGARHKNAVMWMKSLVCGHSNQTSLIILAVTYY